ncbi:MAG: hypothetical protein ACLTLQ_06365 [[Clostridium] scindens]
MEFTPEDGQVFAVLYSDKNKDFTYKDTDDRRGTVSIFSRETSYRKRRMVGYYGVDMLSKATSTKAKKPSISAVRLNNEDTLNLTFHLSKVKKAVQELKIRAPSTTELRREGAAAAGFTRRKEDKE